MRRTKGPQELQPAPGELRILHAFLNTLDRETGRDELTAPGALAAWLRRRNLLDAGVEFDAAELERMLQVRECWRSLLAGPPEQEDILEVLVRATATVPFRIRHEAGGVTHFESQAGGLDGALGRLLLIVHEAQSGGAWDLLKVCARPACRAVFYDFSPNHSGKWCRPRCGNRRSSRMSKRRRRRYFRQAMASRSGGREPRAERAGPGLSLEEMHPLLRDAEE